MSDFIVTSGADVCARGHTIWGRLAPSRLNGVFESAGCTRGGSCRFFRPNVPVEQGTAFRCPSDFMQFLSSVPLGVATDITVADRALETLANRADAASRRTRTVTTTEPTQPFGLPDIPLRPAPDFSVADSSKPSGLVETVLDWWKGPDVEQTAWAPEATETKPFADAVASGVSSVVGDVAWQGSEQPPLVDEPMTASIFSSGWLPIGVAVGVVAVGIGAYLYMRK